MRFHGAVTFTNKCSLAIRLIKEVENDRFILTYIDILSSQYCHSEIRGTSFHLD